MTWFSLLSIRLDFFLLTLMLLCALSIVYTRQLFTIAMLVSVFSFLSACLFFMYDAVDVAFTEASVGAGLSTILFLATIILTGENNRKKRANINSYFLVFLMTMVAIILSFLLMNAPKFGDPNAPANLHVANQYLLHSLRDTHVPNVVSSVLASYRGYDTFGETTVVFTALLGVFSLFINFSPRFSFKREPAIAKLIALNERNSNKSFKNYIIVRMISKLLIPFILLFALYIQFHGDHGPGGGFQAGMTFGLSAITLCLLYGFEKTIEVFPKRLMLFLSVFGVMIYGGVGIISLLLGAPFLDYNVFSLNHASGQELGITIVELGVGITVASVAISLFLIFVEQSVYDRIFKEGECSK